MHDELYNGASSVQQDECFLGNQDFIDDVDRTVGRLQIPFNEIGRDV